MFNENEAFIIVDDLIKFLLCELRQRKMPISHFRIQKTIFKIKMELGKNHPLYENLPFYWYNHGPFSNIVGNEFMEIKENYCHNYSSNTIFLDNDFFNKFSTKNSLIEDYPIIKNISEDIFKDPNLFFNRFDEEIYIDYAPYSFMHPFKYILFETTRDDDLLYNLSPDKYLDVYYNCLSQLPNDNLLNPFSELFSRLFSRLELINDENQFMNCWKILQNPIQDSWFTFASGIRIKFHDSFYDNQLKDWQMKFDKNILELNKSINFLEDKTNFILNDSSNEPNPDSFERGIYDATIGNYLRD